MGGLMPHVSIRHTVPLLVAALALGSGPAQAQDVPTAPAPESRILIQTANGEFIDARMSAARTDSILVRKGKQTIAIPVEDVRGVWTWRRDGIGGLKAGAIYGVLTGLVYGLGVPTDCINCDEERGSSDAILGSMLGNTVFFGIFGLVTGLWDGAWDVQPGFPGPQATAAGEPFPLWSLSASVGGTHNTYREETKPSFAIAGYRNSRPGSSMGFEVGLLEIAKREPYSVTYRIPPQYLPPGSPPGAGGPFTVQGEDETAWNYVTFFIARARGTKGTVRAQFLGGPAAYARSYASTSTTRDSTGAVIATFSGSSVQSSLGVMAGFGATVGKGSLLPALRARGHWIFNGAETFAFTVEAGVDFH